MNDFDIEFNPNYWAIMPADVRYDENLKPMEKILYAELTSLTKKHGYCWARNKYFAQLYNVTERSIQNWLANLEKRGYLRTEFEKNKDGTLRKIYMNEALNFTDQNFREVKKNSGEGRKNFRVGGEEIFTHNNININNINNNNKKKYIKEKGYSNLIEDYTDNSKLIEAINDFIEMRKTIKKPPTKRALKIILNKLSKFGSSDDEKIQILERSIVNCWQDVYELNANKWGDKNGAKGDNQGHTRSAGVEEFIRRQEQLQKDSPF